MRRVDRAVSSIYSRATENRGPVYLIRAEFTRTKDDLVEASLRELHRSGHVRRLRRQASIVVVLVFGVLTSYYGWQNWQAAGQKFALTMVFALYLPLTVLLLWLLLRRLGPAALRARLRRSVDHKLYERYTGYRAVTLTDEHIRVEGQHIDLRFGWRGVGAIDATAERMFIDVPAANTLIVPATAFESTEAFEEFIAAARRMRDAAQTVGVEE